MRNGIKTGRNVVEACYNKVKHQALKERPVNISRLSGFLPAVTLWQAGAIRTDSIPAFAMQKKLNLLILPALCRLPRSDPALQMPEIKHPRYKRG